MKVDLLFRAGIHALVTSRPDLTAEDLFAGLFRAAISAIDEQARPPAVVKKQPAEGHLPAVDPPPARPPKPRKARSAPAQKVAARRKMIAKAAAKPVRPLRVVRKPARPQARSPLSKHGAKRRPPLQAVPPSPTKNFRTRQDLVDAIDRASDGMLSRYLEILDNESPHLASLSRALSRPPRWAFRSWRDAVSAVAKPGSCCWQDVVPDRLARVNEAIRDALTASAGGVAELSRHGMGAYVDLRLPDETEAVLEAKRWREEGGDGFQTARGGAF